MPNPVGDYAEAVPAEEQEAGTEDDR